MPKFRTEKSNMFLFVVVVAWTFSATANATQDYITVLEAMPSSRETLILDDYDIPFLNASYFKRFVNMTSLTLKDCRMEEIETDFFANMTNLIVLNLEHNNLTELPTQGLDQLERLNLGRNEFTNLGFLKQLKALKYLVLNKNHLTVIKTDDFKENTELVTLHLEHCHDLLTVEDSSFSNLTKLTELAFEMTKITSTNGLLKGLVNLITLHIGNHLESPIRTNDFKDVTKLETLVLKSNSLKAVDIANLPKSVKVLDLSENAIEELADNAFSSFTNLETLRLQNQKKTPVALQGNPFTNSPLKELNLESNGIPDLPIPLLEALQTQKISAHLAGNDFNCTCHDVKIWEWFQNKTIPFRYPCAEPSRLRGQDLVTLSAVSLGCVAPYFTSKSDQRVHIGDPRGDVSIHCEARSFYERPVIVYQVHKGNPLGILNASVTVRYIHWQRVELEQMRYYSAISFNNDGARENQTGSIQCRAENQWGNSTQIVTPKYFRPGLLLPVWAIATITCTAVVLIMVAVVIVLCNKRRKSDSCDMIGTVNGHVRNLVV